MKKLQFAITTYEKSIEILHRKKGCHPQLRLWVRRGSSQANWNLHLIVGIVMSFVIISATGVRTFSAEKENQSCPNNFKVITDPYGMQWCQLDLSLTPLSSVSSIDFEKIRNLKLTALTADLLPFFANITELSNLQALDVSWNRMGPMGANAIVENANFKNLIYLNMGYNSLQTEGVMIILNSKNILSRVKNLDLEGNAITPDGIKQIVDSAAVERLDTLILSNNSIGDDGTIILARSNRLKKLTRLYLRSNDITDKGAKAIAKSSISDNLEYLDLYYNSIDDAGAVALARSRHLSRLSYLNLNYNYVADKGASAIADSKYLRNLRTFEIWHNNLTDKGVAAIATSDNMKNLEYLNLSYNNYSDEGLLSLAAPGVLPALKKLDVSHIQYGTPGATAISDLIRRGVEVIH